MTNPNLENKIQQTLHSGQSVFLVGPENSGKTWFIKNRLLPYFKKNHKKVVYFKNCEKISDSLFKKIDYAIVDEVETLKDLKFLEKTHPLEKPYYSNLYLIKVRAWFKLLKNIKQPGVFIVSREKKAIKNFIKNIKTIDWNRKKVKVIEFKSRKKAT